VGADDDTEVSIGATVRGEIESVGVSDLHRFEAAAGDRVWVTVDAVNGDCVAGPDEHLGWELVSPVGERAAVQPDIRACSERGPLTLEDAGTWTLVVSAGENDPSTGTYALRVRGVGADDDTEVSIGATVRGEIESVGVSDLHRFEAAAGDRVWVTVDAVNGDCVAGPDEHLGWELVSPVGERAAVQPDIRACSERGPLTLEDAGTWTLVVSAGENDPIDGHLRPPPPRRGTLNRCRGRSDGEHREGS
jgi:hypothetical protein